MHRRGGVVRRERASERLDARRLIFEHQRSRGYAVGCKTVHIDVHGNLLALRSDYLRVREFGDGAQTVGEVIGIFLHLHISLVRGFEGYEDGSEVAEVVENYNREYAGRERLPEGFQLQAYLRPDFIFLVGGSREVRIDIADAVLADDLGVLPVDFLHREEEFLEGLPHLFLHLMHVCAGIDGGDEPLFYLESRELVLVHIHQTEDSTSDEQDKEKPDYVIVLNRPPDDL